ncbi:peroxiredoxin [Desulfovibrio litoralis]|uniref:Alkyl hydroperoxide reductase C n=1 Tax=Desulfovibrio litoralis DSM 11393 TaxID=1121455 RepID=A0A1M7T315_9BACT|nr:redoxin domain-containing protein [Desulfovibrio litoralis]SHN65091.1 peroxiredoxin (alkyl hydroperoxide reductase subunit C) [Desulfovibrio litoralis DSM 11393]
MVNINTCTSSGLQLGTLIKNFKFSSYNPDVDKFEEHSFSEYVLAQKWLVLFFYPADFTFVCPTELYDISSCYGELQKNNVEVVSMSTDTKFSHLAWYKAEELLHDIKFQMGADPTGEIASYFGVYDSDAGTALRGTFIINPEGILVGSEINYYNVGRNATELLRKMKAYTYVYKNPHHVCPAAWEEGEGVLTPSEALVGRVSNNFEVK